MKYYIIARSMFDEIWYSYGTTLKKSRQFPGFYELTGIVKKFYTGKVPLREIIQIDTIYSIWEVEETQLELIEGGLK